MSTQFYTLPVREVKRETNDTVSISFSVPENLSGTFKFKPGQYLTIKKQLGGQEVRRSYSICTSPSQHDLRVAVKRIEKGLFSAYATQDLKAGDSLEVMAPMGNFILKSDSSATGEHVFIAAGSGITPVISMIRSLLEDEKGNKVTLYYSNKTESDIIFKSELNSLVANYSNFNLHYILTRSNQTGLLHGRIDQAKLESIYAANHQGSGILGVYVCGPHALINLAKDFFVSKGLPASAIHFELFTAVTAEPKAASGAQVNAAMTVIIDDEPYNFTLSSSGKSILQAAQDAGADVPFSCKGGVCCTCKAKVLEGKASMDLNYALEPDEVEAGFILTCQAHPQTDKVVVSFDEY